MLAKNRTSAIALMAAAALSLGGCEASRMADSNIAVSNTEAEVNTRRAQEPVPTRVADAVLVNDDMWLGRSAFEAVKGEPLPPDTDQFTFVSAIPQTLAQVTAEITALTGIPVSLEMVELEDTAQTEDAEDAGEGDGEDAGGAADATGEIAVAPATDVDTGTSQAYTQLTGPPALLVSELNYSGTLAGFMDYLTALVQADWVYENGEIRIFNQVSQTFTIVGFPGALTDDSQISGSLGGSDEGAANSSAIQVQNTVASNLLSESAAVVEEIVGDLGSVAINQDSNAITVTGPFFLMREVEEYVTELNRRLARQVTIDVRILRVRVTNTDNYRTDLAAIVTGDSVFNRSLSFNLGAQGAASGFVGANPAVLFGGTIAGSGDTYSALLEALSSVGEVSLVTSAALTTLNGRPAPFNNTRTQAYIASVETDVQNSGGAISTTVTTEIANLNTGFTFHVTPRILGNGQVLVRYSSNIAEGDLTQVVLPPSTPGVQGNTIQLPDTQQQAIQQNFIANSRETVVVAGFERTLNSRDRAGVGTPGNWLLSGQRDAVSEREFFVVMMTPRVQDFSKSFASLNR